MENTHSGFSLPHVLFKVFPDYIFYYKSETNYLTAAKSPALSGEVPQIVSGGPPLMVAQYLCILHPERTIDFVAEYHKNNAIIQKSKIQQLSNYLIEATRTIRTLTIGIDLYAQSQDDYICIGCGAKSPPVDVSHDSECPVYKANLWLVENISEILNLTSNSIGE